MRWEKLGVIYKPDGSSSWAKSHAMIPTPIRLNDEVIRVYLCFRDANSVGRAGYVDIAADDPLKVLKVSQQPVLDIGQPGTFDENGVLPTCVIDGPDNTYYMYYVGFELGTKIRYRLLTGLAISKDGGETFERIQQTPILERSTEELYFRGGPFVLYEENLFKMWYVAGSDWILIDGKTMPVYDLKYIESPNGIDWPSVGKTVMMVTDHDEFGFGRPYVTKGKDVYELHYSIRKRSLNTYRLGYAESEDGLNWHRKDNELRLDVSLTGWDSAAIMYSAVINVNNNTYLFYNGNNFGETGFGLAKKL